MTRRRRDLIPAAHAADWLAGRGRRGLRKGESGQQWVVEPNGPGEELVEAVEDQYKLQQQLAAVLTMQQDRELRADDTGEQLVTDLFKDLRIQLDMVAQRKASAMERLWQWGTLFNDGDAEDA